MKKNTKRKLKKYLKYAAIILLVLFGAFEHRIRNYLTPPEITMHEDTVKYKVRYRYTMDGDTVVFSYNGEDLTCRFLAVDTPESDEEGYDEACSFTHNELRRANNITLEMDPESPDKDKFDRLLVWVWVDDELLQAKMIEAGTCEIRYLFNDYLYTDYLYKKQAEKNNVTSAQ